MAAPPGFVIRPGTPDDVAEWHRSRWLQNEDNGEGGRYFSPRRNAHAGAPPRHPEAEDRDVSRLCLSSRQPGWLRLWLAEDHAGALVGHVTLHGPSLDASLHRATLGVGLVRAHRGRGLGTALLEAALAWARSTPELAWVDLGVYSTNPDAERLYRRLGFVETGRVQDDLRLDGVSIGQVYMTRDVRDR